MPRIEHPIVQVGKIATEFHHWRSEYKNKGEQASTCWTIEKHLEELDECFSHLPAHRVSNDTKKNRGMRMFTTIRRFPSNVMKQCLVS